MSKLIEGRINLLTGNGMVGLMLVVLALWLFMDLKLSFWVGMGIPISLLGGLGIIAFFGHSINMLNLFGMIMVLGIIVDDAIVVGESIYVKSCEGLSPIDAAIQGTKEVFWPVVAAVTTTIVAFIPLFYVPGIMGKFIGVIPPIVVGALVISLVESLFLLPIHLKNLKTTKKIIKGDANFFVKLGGKVDIIRKKFQQMLTFMINKLYTPLLKKCLHFRYLAMAFTSVLIFLVSALVMSGKIKYLTFPDIDSDYLVASVEFPVGTSIEKTSEAVKKLEEAWFEVDNFYEKEKGESITKAVLANIGTIMGQKTINGDHIGQILLELMPAEKRNVYHKVLAQKWRDCLEGIEGAITVRIETIKHGPPGKDLEIWFLSNDPKTLEHSSAELVRYLEKMEGVVDIDSSLRDGKTEFLLTLKPSAHYHNISLAQVAKAVRDRYYGNEVMRMQRGRDEVKINIRLSRNERESVENLKSVKIKTQSGDIPLSYFVHIEVKKELFKIERTRGKRKVAVTASIFGGKDNTTPTEVLNVLRKELFPQMRENYDDLNISEEGKANESKESNEGMVSGLLMALLGIYLIVATVFKSYIQPVVVMLVIPLGMVGAVIGHMILDIPLSMFSFFGIVALTGIVVNDSIIMVEGINGNLDKGKDLKDALISSGIRRFRPIILTTLTTSAGLFPMILERSMQAQFLIPMAVSLVFGVIFATGLTLIIIPCLYNILNDFRRIFYWHLTGVWSSREFVEPRFK